MTTLTVKQAETLEKLEYALFMEENPMATIRDFNAHLLMINGGRGEELAKPAEAARRRRELMACGVV